jgi:L-asparagine oxygenase
MDILKLIQGAPIDADLPPTPDHGRTPEVDVTPVCTATLRKVAEEYHCDIVGYPDEKDGALIHQVIPIQGREASKSNEGSAFFELHTEVPHYRENPDYLALLCLRGDPTARTMYVFWDDVRQELPGWALPELSAGHWLHRSGYSFGNVTEVVMGLEDAGGFARVDFSCVKAIDADGHRIMDAIGGILKRPGILQTLVLQPGDLLVMDNRKVLHGRVGFTPTYDGNHRWLQRIYMRRRQDA